MVLAAIPWLRAGPDDDVAAVMEVMIGIAALVVLVVLSITSHGDRGERSTTTVLRPLGIPLAILVVLIGIERVLSYLD